MCVRSTAMDGAAKSAVFGDRDGPLSAAERRDIGSRFHEYQRQLTPPGSIAAVSVLDLALAVRTTVPDPDSTVFWDSAVHRDAYTWLMGREPKDYRSMGPGRAVSESVGCAIARTLRRDPGSVVACS